MNCKDCKYTLKHCWKNDCETCPLYEEDTDECACNTYNWTKNCPYYEEYKEDE